jgi:hypothetical protein
MAKKELLRRLSELESLNDQLHAEIRYLDALLKEVGFEEGLVTLKKTAQEWLQDDKG